MIFVWLAWDCWRVNSWPILLFSFALYLFFMFDLPWTFLYVNKVECMFPQMFQMSTFQLCMYQPCLCGMPVWNCCQLAHGPRCQVKATNILLCLVTRRQILKIIHAVLATLAKPHFLALRNILVMKVFYLTDHWPDTT